MKWFLFAATIAAVLPESAIAAAPYGVLQADTNGDGAVSRAEFIAMNTARFNRMDVNHDSYLSFEERIPERAPNNLPKLDPKTPWRPGNTDADNDQRVSRDEFFFNIGMIFLRYDGNHDDQISGDEIAPELHSVPATQVQPTAAQPTQVPLTTPRLGRSVPHGTRSNEIMQMKITVTDFERSLKFYRDGIGLISAIKSFDISNGDHLPWRGEFRELPLNFTGSIAEAYFTLMQRKGVSPIPDQAKLTVIGIKVKDVSQTLDRLKAAEFASGEARQLGPEFRIAMVTDPDGYQIELIESPTAAPSPPG